MSVMESTQQREVEETTPATEDQIVRRLSDAYLMEIETVMNYLAASTNLDGLHGRQVAELLSADVAEELQHAERFAFTEASRSRARKANQSNQRR